MSPGRRIPVTRPCFDAEEERLLLEVIRSGWVAQGPQVRELESRFAATVGASEAVAVSSGTAALFLSLHALGIGPGDEVIVPSLSFIASTNAVVHAGAEPVFVDVDPRSYNVEAAGIEAALSSRTRAIMPVHQLGLPADLEGIGELAQAHGLPIVEDAACAVGSRYRGRPIGSAGNLACFSFHARKLLTCGEGGMITTDDAELAQRLRRLRHQGMSVSDLERDRSDRVIIEEYPEIGYNFRLSDLQAAVALVQLGKLERFLARRRALAARYASRLVALEDVELPQIPKEAEPSYQSFIVRLRGADAERRNRLLDQLQRRGVASRRGLMAAHHESCHAQRRRATELEHSDRASAQTFLLPIYNDMTDEEQDQVIEALHEALASPDEAQGARP